MARAIPAGVGVVNAKVSRLGRRRGVGVGVSSVCAHHDETHSSRQSKEQTYARLVDARGIRLSEAKLWSGTLGSIAAHASFVSPIRPYDIISMGMQHRGARWIRTRYANDVLLLMRIEMLPFRGKPEIPNRELLELGTGEGNKDLFVGCSFTTDVMD
jgi:hypothetical protein